MEDKYGPINPTLIKIKNFSSKEIFLWKFIRLTPIIFQFALKKRKKTNSNPSLKIIDSALGREKYEEEEKGKDRKEKKRKKKKKVEPNSIPSHSKLERCSFFF